MSDPISIQAIQEMLVEIRGQQVLIDADVARIYAVETKRINEAVRNNRDKFPEGYLLELSHAEWNSLKTKFSTSTWGGKHKLPKAFTERGLYMLATILKSKQATKATLNIIESFANLRKLSSTINALSSSTDKKTRPRSEKLWISHKGTKAPRTTENEKGKTPPQREAHP